MEATPKANPKAEAPSLTLGEIQEKFHALWDKRLHGLTTPEEDTWMLKVQESYWDNPVSLGNLYRK